MPAAGKATHKVEIHPTREDYWRYSAVAIKRAPVSRYYHMGIGLSVGLVLLLNAFLAPYDLDTPLMSIGFFLLFFGSTMKFLSPRLMKSCVAEDQQWAMPKVFELTKNGFSKKTKHSRAEYDWEIVTEIVERRGLIIFFVDRTVGLVIPRNSFDNAAAADEFVAAAKGYLAAAKGHANKQADVA